MTTSQERERLKEVYPSKKWTDKVNAMSDSQVHAVFVRLKNQGKM